MVFMFPTWLMSFYKEGDLVSSKSNLGSQLASLNIASTTDSIKALNNQITIMDKVLEYPELVPYLDFVIKQKTVLIKISNISYVVTDVKNSQLNIDGVSNNREALRDFVKTLEASGKFKTVDIPVSNYAKDKDLPFSIKLTISEQ